MAKSITVHQKRRGRPATGRDPAVTIRLREETLVAVDAWASRQEDRPARSPAIRRLVEQALAADIASIDAKSGIKRTPAKTAARAAELAAKAIDKHLDPAALAEERSARKRRTLKGPSIVRDLRKD